MKKIPNKENSIYLCWRVVWTLGFSILLLGCLVAFFSLNTGFTGMTPPAIVALCGAAAIPAVPLYTLPAYFAYRKEMPDRRKLLWVNLLLGWTVVGYIACAIWCRKNNP